MKPSIFRKKYMLPELFFLFLFTLLLGCSDNKKNKIYVGDFYLNSEISGDTLFFDTLKPKNIVRNWSWKSWRITKDSIFKDDSRGLFFSFGKEKSTYKMNHDTLVLTYQNEDRGRNVLNYLGKKEPSKIKKKAKPLEDKYIVIQSTESTLHLIEIPISVEHDDTYIKSDIQLKP